MYVYRNFSSLVDGILFKVGRVYLAPKSYLIGANVD